MPKTEISACMAAAGTLPHLKARPLIHANLLRPVQLNRTKTTGHPGGPPPAPGGRKRRKRHKHRFSDDGWQAHGEKSQDIFNFSNRRAESSELYPVMRIRRSEDRDRRKYFGSKGCYPVEQTPLHRGGDYPGSEDIARRIHASFKSPEYIRQGADALGATPDCSIDNISLREVKSTHRSRTHRLDDDNLGASRNPSGVRSQTGGEDPADLAVAVAKGKRRSSLLRFRPATRQELCHPYNQKAKKAAGGGRQYQPRSLTEPEYAGQLKLLAGGHDGGETACDTAKLSLLNLQEREEGGCLDNQQEEPQHQACVSTGYSGQIGGETKKISQHSVKYGKYDPFPTETARSCPVNRVDGGAFDGAPNPGTDSSSGKQLPVYNNKNNKNNNCGVSEALIVRQGFTSSSYPVKTTMYHVARCLCEPCRRERSRRVPGPPARPTFKTVGVEPRLVSTTLQIHGFKRQIGGRSARESVEAGWRVLWSSQHLRSCAFRNLKQGQKINSFPRTYECTRKDALSRNMNRMSQIHGSRHFDFAPRGFVLPAEREAVREAMLEAPEGEAWIVKPASSACGRGIFITRDFVDMPISGGSEGNWIAQRYVGNPMLLDGLKFDLRLYVAVTSFCPLRVYLHEEGLCRLATEPYSTDANSFGNRFVHLTNYSINRKSSRYERASTSLSNADDNDCNDYNSNDGVAADDEPPEHKSPNSSSTPFRGTNITDAAFSTPPRTSASNYSSVWNPATGTAKTAPTALTGGRDENAIAFAMASGNGRQHRISKLKKAKTVPTEPLVCRKVAEGENVSDSGFCGKRQERKAKRRRGSMGGVFPSPTGMEGGFGSKWSLQVLWRRLEVMGVDVPALWGNIHDVVIKTLIAIEAQVSAAVGLLGIRRGSCFEMFGFDVLIDRHQKPYLLEVNFAPSLNTDSDLDLEVKSKVVADLLTLAGIRGHPGHHRPRSPATPTALTPSGISKPGVEHHRRKISQQHREMGGGGGVGRDEIIGKVATLDVGATVKAEATGSRGGRGRGRERREGVNAVASGRTSVVQLQKHNHGAVAEDIDSGHVFERPTFKGGERGRSVGRSSNKQPNKTTIRGTSGGAGGGDRVAPAWEGCCGSREETSTLADEVSAVTADSASELRRSGGFNLIFPVAGTAHKYLKFFDGPRPLDRMLAAISASNSPAAICEGNVKRRPGAKRGGNKSGKSNRQEPT